MFSSLQETNGSLWALNSYESAWSFDSNPMPYFCMIYLVLVPSLKWKIELEFYKVMLSVKSIHCPLTKSSLQENVGHYETYKHETIEIMYQGQ
jgi:hypothetical protein